MNIITLVMAYYENPGQLQRQYDLLRSMPDGVKLNVRVIIVDDCSEVAPAVESSIGILLEVYRIKPPKVPWNEMSARNIGVHHALTRWVLCVDMDQMVPRETWESLITTKLDETKAYKFSGVTAPDNRPCKPHANCWLMTTQLYWAIGGGEERFAGCYGWDVEFRDRVREQAEIVWRPEVLISVGPDVVPDASTTQFPRKTPENRAKLRKAASERNAIPGWRPLNLTFPYERVA